MQNNCSYGAQTKLDCVDSWQIYLVSIDRFMSYLSYFKLTFIFITLLTVGWKVESNVCLGGNVFERTKANIFRISQTADANPMLRMYKWKIGTVLNLVAHDKQL